MANSSFSLLHWLFFFCFFHAVFLISSPSMVSLAQDVVGGEATAPEAAGGGRKELVPAMFAFGDSLIDNGNNNNLPSFAKANYYPYGIDFSGGPTGRFSNGYTIVDEIEKRTTDIMRDVMVIAGRQNELVFLVGSKGTIEKRLQNVPKKLDQFASELLGLPLIPPHTQASSDQLLHGVNYASAASGILDITGRNFVGRIPFNQQIRNFASTLELLIANMGADSVSQSIRRCMFFVGMGSNDYLNNYLMPNYNTRMFYNGEQFADLLVSQYMRQLTDLYKLGARKFVISGVGSLSCIPSILAQNFFSTCAPEVDNLVLPFNNNVKLMVNNLNTNLPGAKFIYVDIFHMFMDILRNPGSYGFSVIDRGCCGIGKNSGQITCLPFQTPCVNRDQYVFWDAFHPTAAVNIILGKRAFSDSTNVVYPMNIQQLANLNLCQTN